MAELAKSLNPSDYDLQWQKLDDFIKYNPGARHRRRAILGLIKNIKFDSVFDVGCGPGEIMLAIKRAFPSTHAIEGADFAEELIVNNCLAYPQFKFHLLNIETQTLDAQYDLVICSEAIEHIVAQDKVFANLVKMVKPGGHLIITCPTGKIFNTQKHFGHIHHPSVYELNGYAENNGLQKVYLNNWGWPFYKIMQQVINLRSDVIIKHFAEGRYNLIKKIINNTVYYFHFLNLKNSKHGVQLFTLFKKPKA